MTSSKPINPWVFVPALYFLQSIPVALVQDTATILYKSLGHANTEIATWTSLAALPWALQFLLGPLVDLIGRKRGWVTGTHIGIGALLAAIPFSIGSPNGFAISLALFAAMAVLSVLGNVAQDGFYLLALPKDRQAAFAGVQTTSYRLGTLFSKGLIVLVAGLIAGTKIAEAQGVVPPGVLQGWTIALLAAAGLYWLGALYLRVALPRPEEDRSGSGNAAPVVLRTLGIVGLALSSYFAANAIVRLAANAIATEKTKGWMLPEVNKVLGWEIGLSPQGVEIVQLAVCGTLAVGLFVDLRRGLRGTEMGEAFGSYFRQPGILSILYFLMFYRFGEAMVAKMSPLFLQDKVANGGLGLDTATVGTIKGVVGVVGIILGGILGGIVVSQFGLRRSFWTLAICMHLPILLYLYAAIARPSVAVMYPIDFVDQFGYGFGFAGYMIFQMRVAQRGNFRTTHYAMGVGIGAMFISLAGIVSGKLQEAVGWPGFFAAAAVMAIPGLLAVRLIPAEVAEG